MQHQADPRVPELLPPQAAGKGALPVAADANGDGVADALEARIADADPGEQFDVIVVFEGPRRALERAREVAGSFRVEREFTIFNGFQAGMTGAQIRALSAAPGILRIEENGEVWAFDVPANDDAGVTAARASYPGDGSGVTVCVIDSGINADHEQFTAQAWASGDFVDLTSNGGSSPYDDNGHGTHVAGILAGDGSGADPTIASQALGVAPGVSLRIAKVLNSSGGGTQANVISAIEWCAGADIVSMSLGSNPTDGTDPVSLAVNCGSDPQYDPSCDPALAPAIFVIAAGNAGNEPGTVASPGVARTAITAAAFAEWSAEFGDSWRDEGVYLNPFSGRGPVLTGSGQAPWLKPDIAGPGSRVLSAYVNSADPGQQAPDAYAVASGTSMSTPFVAGVVALMLEANPDLGDVVDGDSRLPHEKVRQILADTAVDVGPAGPDNEYGYGLIDALAAVAEASGLWDGSEATEYPLLPPVSGSVGQYGEWTYELQVSQGYVDQRLPVAATLTIEGECVLFFGTCAAGYSWWDPDLEMVVERDLGGGDWQMVSADAGEVTLSECPGRGECHNSVGRVEVVHFTPDEAGLYRFRVWPYGDAPNDGAGGTFGFELSMLGAVPDGNASPAVTITAPANGSGFPAGEPVTFTGSSLDEDGDLSASLSWSSSIDGALGTGSSVATSALSAGVHQVTASVTDSGGRTGSASVEVTIQVGAHVADLDDASTLQGGRWEARVNIHVMDDRTPASPVADALFTGTWSDGLSGTADCVTDGQGRCTVIRTGLKKNVGGATLTVDNVGGAGVAGYDSSLNGDPDGDSDGTRIRIVQPGTSSNEPPMAHFMSDCTGLDCVFLDLSSDSDGAFASWFWSFGDGATSSQQNPSHSYADDGTYIVELTVTDNAGAADTTSQQVAVSGGGGGEPPPSAAPTLLNADGYKVKGVHTVDLGWEGATTADIVLHRDGTGGPYQETVSNAGSDPHMITHSVGNKGGGQYEFWICETDGSPCSNAIIVVF